MQIKNLSKTILYHDVLTKLASILFMDLDVLMFYFSFDEEYKTNELDKESNFYVIKEDTLSVKNQYYQKKIKNANLYDSITFKTFFDKLLFFPNYDEKNLNNLDFIGTFKMKSDFQVSFYHLFHHNETNKFFISAKHKKNFLCLGLNIKGSKK